MTFDQLYVSFSVPFYSHYNFLTIVYVSRKVEITPHNKHLLSQVAFGCAHLSKEDIDIAITQVLTDPCSQKQICECIYEIKKQNLIPVKTKRHPVILLIDQVIELALYFKNHQAEI